MIPNYLFAEQMILWYCSIRSTIPRYRGTSRVLQAPFVLCLIRRGYLLRRQVSNTFSNTATEMSSFWRIFLHRLYRKLSFWQKSEHAISVSMHFWPTQYLCRSTGKIHKIITLLILKVESVFMGFIIIVPLAAPCGCPSLEIAQNLPRFRLPTWNYDPVVPKTKSLIASVSLKVKW